jgi:hypothetical protein
VLIDNSVYLAFQTLHRHQVHPDFRVWDQFTADGKPIYPQRPNFIGPRMAYQGTGSIQSGRFGGKMIAVQTMMDEAAFPYMAAWYRDLVARHLGDKLDDQYRLWFIDHAMHTSAEPMAGLVMADTTPARRTRMINYIGVLQQALRDVAAWVENGIAPPASTAFALADGQVTLPATAEDRRGVQAVVELTANGGVRADVKIGDEVSFVASIVVPQSAGTIIGTEWDFEGTGEYALKSGWLDGASTRAVLSATHTFAAPGTYFPAVRVTSHRSGSLTSPHARIQNLGRVRVVVDPT